MWSQFSLLCKNGGRHKSNISVENECKRVSEHNNIKKGRQRRKRRKKEGRKETICIQIKALKKLLACLGVGWRTNVDGSDGDDIALNSFIDFIHSLFIYFSSSFHYKIQEFYINTYDLPHLSCFLLFFFVSFFWMHAWHFVLWCACEITVTY